MGLTDQLKSLTGGDDKLLAILIAALAGAVLTKLIPYLWKLLGAGLSRLGRSFGGRLAYRSFERHYLDWLCLHLRELRLTGITTAEEAKRPQLEQVFVSVKVAEPTPDDLRETVARACKAGFSHRNLTWPAFLEHFAAALDRSLGGSQSDHRLIEQIVVETLDSPNRSVKPGSFRRSFSRFISFAKRCEIRTIGKTRAPNLQELALVKWPEARRAFHQPSGDAGLKRLVRTSNRVAILGAPGAGKSTLLQYIGLAFARERAGDAKLRQRGILKERFGFAKWRVPVFVPLSVLSDLLSHEKGDRRDASIPKLLPRLLPSDLQDDYSDVAESYFKSRLMKGQCIVLLDGLDEVAKEGDLEVLVTNLHRMVQRYPENQFLMTSRIAAWRGLFDDFKTCYVSDLSDEQVSRFIDAWYSAVEKNAVVGKLQDEGRAERLGRERRADRKASDLKDALQTNIGVRLLATNPMLLSIIAIVHRNFATLPKERAKLYDQCARILLEQWDISRGVRVDDTGLKFEQKQAIMQRLAFAFHTGEVGQIGGGREAGTEDVQRLIAELLPSLGRTQIEAVRLLQRLVERSGLLLERRRGVLTFAHLTFQEYFCAQYLAAQAPNLSRDYLLESSRVTTDWWREVSRLYAGLIPDCSLLLEGLLSREDDLTKSSLRAASLCAAESVQVHDAAIRDAVAVGALAVRCAGRCRRFRTPPDRTVVDYVTGWADSVEWLENAAVSTVQNNPGAHVNQILEGLGDTRPPVRAAAARAAEALTVHTAPKEIRSNIQERLKELRDDPARRVRLAVTRTIATLVRRGDCDASVLVSMLAGPWDDELFVSASEGLASLPDEFDDDLWKLIAVSDPRSFRGQRALLEALPLRLSHRLLASRRDQDATHEGDSTSEFVVAECLGIALGRDLTSATLDLLQELLDDNRIPRKVAAKALRELNPQSGHRAQALSLASSMLAADEKSVRLIAVGTVASLYNDSMAAQLASHLRPVLESERHETAVTALDVLRLTQSRRLIDLLGVPLTQLMRSRKRKLRIAAAALLVDAGDRAASGEALQFTERALRSTNIAGRLTALRYLQLPCDRPEVLRRCTSGILFGLKLPLTSARASAVALLARHQNSQVPKELVEGLLRRLRSLDEIVLAPTSRFGHPVLPQWDSLAAAGIILRTWRRERIFFPPAMLDADIQPANAAFQSALSAVVTPDTVDELVRGLVIAFENGDHHIRAMALQNLVAIAKNGYDALVLRSVVTSITRNPLLLRDNDRDYAMMVTADGITWQRHISDGKWWFVHGTAEPFDAILDLGASSSAETVEPLIEELSASVDLNLRGCALLLSAGAKSTSAASKSLLTAMLNADDAEILPYLGAALRTLHSSSLDVASLLVPDERGFLPINPIFLRDQWSLCEELVAVQ